MAMYFEPVLSTYRQAENIMVKPLTSEMFAAMGHSLAFWGWDFAFSYGSLRTAKAD